MSVIENFQNSKGNFYKKPKKEAKKRAKKRYNPDKDYHNLELGPPSLSLSLPN